MSKMSDIMDLKFGVDNSQQLINDYEVYPFLKDKFFDFRSNINKPIKPIIQKTPKIERPPEPVELKPIAIIEVKPTPKPVKKLPDRVLNSVNQVNYYEQAKAERELIDNSVENEHKIDWHKVKLLKLQNAAIFETL